MTVRLLCEKCGFEALSLPTPDRDIDGVYIGDLLSWVMGRAEADNVWITIMTNVNIVAVATLADVSCILLAEGVRPDGEIVELAKAKGVNVLKTPLSAYEAAITVSESFK